MSNLRTKLLGVAAVATAFAGISYGQVTCMAVTNAPGGQINPSLRAEGETELLGDFYVTCNNAGAATSGTLYVTASAPVTSKAVTIALLPSNEATLLINGVANANQGVVTGDQVAFTIPAAGIPAGAFTLQVSNIRVNASAATNPQITETGVLSVAQGGTTTNVALLAAGAPYNAGFVLTSLGGTALVPFGTTNYTTCVGNPGTPFLNIPAGVSFTVQIKELVGGAFKTNGAAAAGGEGGSYVPGGANAAGIGTASTATELQLTLGNVPASATVYVPQSISVTQTGTTTLAINSTPIASGAYANMVAISPVSGTVTATYVVTAVGSVGATTFNVPVTVEFAANSAAGQTSPITALVSYAPTGTVTGPAAAIPTFAASTATPVNGSTVTTCSTTLLFPYVTNATGFETGIAVVNATTDNLGTIPGKPSAASPVNGTCTINFYGNAAQPTAVTTPTIGAYTSAAPTVVPIYANILTSMIGSSGFTGYAIAQCNFLEGHGFAFITDTTGSFSGTEGYLATVIPAARGENTTDATSLTVSLSSFTLSENLVTGAITGTATGSASGTVSGVTGQ